MTVIIRNLNLKWITFKLRVHKRCGQLRCGASRVACKLGVKLACNAAWTDLVTESQLRQPSKKTVTPDGCFSLNGFFHF